MIANVVFRQSRGASKSRPELQIVPNASARWAPHSSIPSYRGIDMADSDPDSIRPSTSKKHFIIVASRLRRHWVEGCRLISHAEVIIDN